MKTLKVTYPPDFDGELHIKAELTSTRPGVGLVLGGDGINPTVGFSFSRAVSPGTVQAENGPSVEWTTLVQAAREILDEDARRKAVR